jgi:hypothetical protein
VGVYKVTRDYRANSNGTHLAFSVGGACEVEDRVAEWVNRDSPGTLVPASKAEPEPEPEPVVEQAKPDPRRRRKAGD